MATLDPAVTAKIRKMWGHLERNPFWMPSPRSWTWKRPDGHYQGFAGMGQDNPGIANLLWLTLDMATVPKTYNAAENSLFQYVIVHASKVKIGHIPLLDAASFYTLREFEAMLPHTVPVTRNPLERAFPLLKLLAQRRLREDT